MLRAGACGATHKHTRARDEASTLRWISLSCQHGQIVLPILRTRVRTVEVTYAPRFRFRVEIAVDPSGSTFS